MDNKNEIVNSQILNENNHKNEFYFFHLIWLILTTLFFLPINLICISIFSNGTPLAGIIIVIIDLFLISLYGGKIIGFYLNYVYNIINIVAIGIPTIIGGINLYIKINKHGENPDVGYFVSQTYSGVNLLLIFGFVIVIVNVFSIIYYNQNKNKIFKSN